MDCKELKEHIFDYLLGELDSVTEMRVNEHLSECKVCQQEVKNIETLLETMKEKKEFTPNKNVYKLIKKRIRIKTGFSPFAFLNKPVKLYYAVATLFLGIFLMSITNLVIDRGKVRPEKIKSRFEAINESQSSDSVVFYTAPSHRLGGT